MTSQRATTRHRKVQEADSSSALLPGTCSIRAVAAPHLEGMEETDPGRLRPRILLLECRSLSLSHPEFKSRAAMPAGENRGPSGQFRIGLSHVTFPMQWRVYPGKTRTCRPT